METITLQQNPYLSGGYYRLPAEDGKPSVDVLDGEWYEAAATDDNGNQYMVYWTIRDGVDSVTDTVESNACDWKKPYAIVQYADRHVNVTGKVRLVL